MVAVFQMVWQAANATQSGTSGEIVEWTDFAFGEPSVLACTAEPAGAGTLLVLFWCVELNQAPFSAGAKLTSSSAAAQVCGAGGRERSDVGRCALREAAPGTNRQQTLARALDCGMRGIDV